MALNTRRQNLVVRLSVEDAEKARQALKSFGDDGAKALRALEKATMPASAGLKVLDGGIALARGSLLKMGGALAAVASAGALVAFSKHTYEAADSLQDMADRLGLSVEGLQELRYAARQAGVEQGVLDIAIQRLGQRMGNIARGEGKEYKAAFDELGISVFKSNGRLKSVEEILPELADGLSRVADQGHRLALMQNLVGREGVGFIVAIQDGAAALDRQREAARRLGIVWSSELVAKAAEASDRMEDLGQVASKRFGGALLELAPLVEDFANGAIFLLAGALDELGQAWQSVTRDMDEWSKSHIEEEIADASARVADLTKRRDELAARAGATNRGIAGAAASGQLRDAQRELQAAMNHLAEAEMAYARIDAREKDRLARRTARPDGMGSLGPTPGDVAAADARAKAFGNVLEEMQRWGDAFDRETEQARGRVEKLQTEAIKATATPAEVARDAHRKALRELDDDYRKGLLSAKQYAEGLTAANLTYTQALKEQADEAQKKANETLFGPVARAQVDTYFDNLAQAGKRAGSFVVDQFQTIEDQLTQTFLHGTFSFQTFVDSVKTGLARLAAQDVVSGLGSLVGFGTPQGQQGGGTVTGSLLQGLVGGATSSLGSSIASFFGFSSGGLVMGPGTETSDSIDRGVRLSRNEFVVNAAATRRYLPLLRRINAQGLPGGLVQRRRGARTRGFAWGGFDGSPEVGPGHAEAVNSDSDTWGGGDDDAMGFAGSPEIGPYHVGFVDAEAAGYGLTNWATRPSNTGLQSVVDAQGRVIDRFGGDFGEQVGTFFGVGTDAGFLGSRALGALLGLASLAIPGGFLVSGLANFALNLGREGLTGGLARHSTTSIPGLLADRVYDDAFAGQSIATRIDQSLGIRGSSGTKNFGAGDLPGRVTPAGVSVSENAAAIASALRDLGYGNDGDSQQAAETRRELAKQNKLMQELLATMARQSGARGGVVTRRTSNGF